MPDIRRVSNWIEYVRYLGTNYKAVVNILPLNSQIITR